MTLNKSVLNSVSDSPPSSPPLPSPPPLPMFPVPPVRNYDLTNRDSVRQLLSHRSSKTKFQELNSTLGEVITGFNSTTTPPHEENDLVIDEKPPSLKLKLLVKKPSQLTVPPKKIKIPKPLKSETLSSVYQDDEYIYPSLHDEEDEEAINSLMNASSSTGNNGDKAWNPKVKVKGVTPRSSGPPARKKAKVAAN